MPSALIVSEIEVLTLVHYRVQQDNVVPSVVNVWLHRGVPAPGTLFPFDSDLLPTNHK